MHQHQPHSQADPTYGLWIACSMHIRRGKTQEIWSHAVASRRQRVDKQGGGPTSIPVLHWPIPSIMNDERYWCCLVSTLVFSSRTETTRASRPFIGERPPSILCLPDIMTHDQTSQAFPLIICILQVLKELRWEWPGNEAILWLTSQKWITREFPNLATNCYTRSCWDC